MPCSQLVSSCGHGATLYLAACVHICTPGSRLRVSLVLAMLTGVVLKVGALQLLNHLWYYALYLLFP